MLDSSNVDTRATSRYERRLGPVLDHVRENLVFADRKDEGNGVTPGDLSAMIAGDDRRPVETRLRETSALRLAYVRIRRPVGTEQAKSWTSRCGIWTAAFRSSPWRPAEERGRSRKK